MKTPPNPALTADCRDASAATGPCSGSLPHYHPVHEVAAALGVSVSHLRREIRGRKIAIIRIGRLIRISPAAVDAYLTARQRKARA